MVDPHARDGKPGGCCRGTRIKQPARRRNRASVRNGKRLPEWLPWVERLIDLPEQDKQCACGHSLVRIGEDCAERIAAISPQIQMIRTVRPKYACHHCEVDQPYRAGTAGWLLYRYRTYVEGCECNERHQQHQPHSSYA